MNDYLLLLREDTSNWAGLSPAEMGEIIQQYRAWSQKLAEQGRLIEGHKLADEGGKRVRGSVGRALVTDGPYAETKDVIGGLFVIRAASYEEAVELVADCPHLRTGNEIEIRRIEILGDGDA